MSIHFFSGQALSTNISILITIQISPFLFLQDYNNIYNYNPLKCCMMCMCVYMCAHILIDRCFCVCMCMYAGMCAHMCMYAGMCAHVYREQRSTQGVISQELPLRILTSILVCLGLTKQARLAGQSAPGSPTVSTSPEWVYQHIPPCPAFLPGSW